MELNIKNISKTYDKDLYALRNFNLKLSTGITGLLGPNGAGKTTLMKIISTILKPSSGEVLLNGENILKNPNSMRNVLGYLPQDFGVYPNLKGYEFLGFIASIKGLSGKQSKKRIAGLLELVNLTYAAKKKISTYSGGMKQRIGIAQVLLNDPKIIILDEPTVGLDPEERVRFRNLIAHLSTDRIVLFSSHIVSDLETIAGNIAIMNQGILCQHKNTYSIAQSAKDRVFEEVVSEDRFDFIKKNHIVSNSKRQSDDSWLVRYILKTANRDGIKGDPVKTTLEDAYLLLTENNKNGLEL